MNILSLLVNSLYNSIIYIDFSICLMTCYTLKITSRKSDMCYYLHIKNSSLYYMDLYYSMHKKVLSKDNTQQRMLDKCTNLMLSMLNTLPLNSFECMFLLRLKYNLFCMMYMTFYYGLYNLLYRQTLSKLFSMSCNFFLQHTQYMLQIQKYNLYNQTFHWCN